MQKTQGSPIFVVGYMHSGTTLLRNILSRHADLYTIRGESKFFEQQPLLRKDFPDLQDKVQRERFVAYLLDRLSEKAYESDTVQKMAAMVANEAARERPHAHVFAAVLDKIAAEAGKSRWLEKTPSHVYHLNEIAQVLPDAKFVEIVRDPRDVLSSKKTRRDTVWTTDRYRPEERERKHLEKAFDALWDTMSWKAAIVAGQQAHEQLVERIVTVRYEDLVNDPASELRRVCKVIGLHFEPQMLDIPAGNAAAWQPKPQEEGLRASSVGRWQGVCRPAEVAVCQWVGEQPMRWHGYEPVPIPATDRARVPVLLVHSIGALFRRIYYRWKAHDIRYVINVLRGYSRRLLRIMHLL